MKRISRSERVTYRSNLDFADLVSKLNKRGINNFAPEAHKGFVDFFLPNIVDEDDVYVQVFSSGKINVFFQRLTKYRRRKVEDDLRALLVPNEKGELEFSITNIGFGPELLEKWLNAAQRVIRNRIILEQTRNTKGIAAVDWNAANLRAYEEIEFELDNEQLTVGNLFGE